MAELLLGLPLFPGESGVDQLVEIIKVRGRRGRVAIGGQERAGSQSEVQCFLFQT